MIETKEKLKNYIEIVCRQVKNRHAHTLIREDIYAHFEEAYLDELDQETSEGEAVDIVLKRLGDPVELGRTFQHIHRSRIDWLIVGLAIALAVLGVLMATNTSTSITHVYVMFGYVRVVIGLGLGLLVGVVLFYVPTHYIKPLAPYILIGTIALMAATDIIGAPRNGQKMLFGINFFQICPYLLTFGAACIFSQPKWLRGWRLCTTIVGILFVGLLFHTGESNSNLALTVAMIFVVAIVSKVPVRVFWLGASVAFASMFLYVLHYPWIKNRFIGAFDAQGHAETVGFYNYQTQQLIHRAGWFGHGLSHSPGLAVFSSRL